MSGLAWRFASIPWLVSHGRFRLRIARLALGALVSTGVVTLALL